MPVCNTNIIAVPTESLRPNPWNTNKMDAASFRKLRESIERVGAFKPVVVREHESGEYEIVGGEHRWAVMNELGWPEIQVVNLGSISDAQAKQVSVLDNERYGEDDDIAFQRLLEDIQSELDYDLSDVMVVDFDLDKVMALASIDSDELLEGLDNDFDAAPERTKETTSGVTGDKTMLRFRVDQDDAVALRNVIKAVIDEQGIATGNEFDDAGEALHFLLITQGR